ncbi:MAG TPA: quinone-interacting membrane-bound oxidoreductase complex subunit QmoC [Bacteroidales bacterium]|nr:quinone-interacting membrane-bound oxidoreductase complex subunit QmoC [Bacteroidales bacterium]
MEDVIQIKTDKRFIRQVKSLGGNPLKECMQCGACSVVCKLSPEENPFPRKEMLWASWGMKDKLIGDPDLWLCHQCGDCSATCPRGVQPATVLSALRHINYLEYASPRFLAVWLSKPVYLPLVVAIPALIILLILWMAGTVSVPDGPVDYSKLFPHPLLNGTFATLVILVLVAYWKGFRRFKRDIRKNQRAKIKGQKSKKNNQKRIRFFYQLKEILLHTQFRKCQTNRLRTLAHILVFSGFLLLLLVTLVAIVNVLFFEYPMNFWHPAKIAGNLGGLALVTGTMMMIWYRLFRKDAIGPSTYADWSFLIFLLLLAVSGILTEWARFGNWSAAYVIYFIHLVLVWIVIIYAPYSKFGHLLYRLAVLILLKDRR